MDNRTQNSLQTLGNLLQIFNKFLTLFIVGFILFPWNASGSRIPNKSMIPFYEGKSLKLYPFLNRKGSKVFDLNPKHADLSGVITKLKDTLGDLIPENKTKMENGGQKPPYFQNRITKVLPEEIGASPKILRKVDSIALNSIQKKVFPGCVILAMKDGKIFYEKAFGTHSYVDKSPTRINDVFDMASVTKISSTLLGVMKAYEQGLIQLDSPLVHYLPETRNTNKKDIIIKDLLTHQAGLIPFIPFYIDAMKEKGVFAKDSSGIFTWRVAEGMYERNNYFSDTMWPRILESPLKTPGKFVYSDLSMYFMRAVLEKVVHQDLKTYVYEQFYKPLGLNSTGFNPRSHIPLKRIMPTEDDTVFRKQVLIGDVHDPGAAMQNAVAGHAGLFSNAHDMAIIGQMLLNLGSFGGREYFKPETVQLFNTRPYPKTNRRALGFDKPDIDPAKYTSVPAMASYDTFGHTGFTGTCIWIDPRNKLIFIFLSNRVNPDAANNKITELSIRPKIHTVFYEALARSAE